MLPTPTNQGLQFLQARIAHLAALWQTAASLAPAPQILYPSNPPSPCPFPPADLGFDPLGLYPADDPEAAYELKTKELNNGRLAMIAWAGFAAQEEVDHITIWKGLVEEHVIPANEANLLPY